MLSFAHFGFLNLWLCSCLWYSDYKLIQRPSQVFVVFYITSIMLEIMMKSSRKRREGSRKEEGNIRRKKNTRAVGIESIQSRPRALEGNSNLAGTVHCVALDTSSLQQTHTIVAYTSPAHFRLRSYPQR